MNPENNGLLSIVLLSYQSEKNMEFAFLTVRDHLQKEKIPFEFIIIDDGSTDKSWQTACGLEGKYNNVRAYRFSRNYTSPYSQFAGLTMASGDCVTFMADDMQRPVANIVSLYRAWQNGAKVVIGHRISRDDGWVSDLFSGLYYRLMNRFSNVRFPKGGTDGFLADREVTDILVHRVSHRNTSPVIEILQLGYDPVFVPFERPVSSGKSRWTARKKIKLALDTFFAASTFPVRMVTVLGFIMFAFAFFASAMVIYAKIFTDNTLFGLPVPGWATIILVTMFFNGMTMLSIGIIAEYIWRIFDEVKGRPPYIIRKKDEP